MKNPSDFRLAVAAHSAIALFTFLAFVLLPRLIPSLKSDGIFLWSCLIAASLAFVSTNAAASRWLRSGPREAE